MRLTDIFAKEEMTLSFEVFPPKANAATYEKIKYAAYSVAALAPSYMSVTYGAGGSNSKNTLSIAKGIQETFGVTTIAHLTCVGATKESIQVSLDAMKEAGIENVLALRGDRPDWMDREPFTDYHYASELAATIKAYGGFCIGGACYPEVHPDSAHKKDDIANLKKKVDAGCEFLTTQMFFDNNIFYKFLYQVREAGISVPIIPGIMPITRASQVENAISMSGCSMPQPFINLVDQFGSNKEAMTQAGIIYASQQIIDLVANGITHIHIYSMNNPKVVKGIQENVSHIMGLDLAR